MQQEKVFVDGLIYKAPRENAPDFVRGSLSVKVDEFKKFLDTYNEKDWVNIDMLKSKKGSIYFALNQWKPQDRGEDSTPAINKTKEEEHPTDEIKVENIPF
jgi:hypothetical protein